MCIFLPCVPRANCYALCTSPLLVTTSRQRNAVARQHMVTQAFPKSPIRAPTLRLAIGLCCQMAREWLATNTPNGSRENSYIAVLKKRGWKNRQLFIFSDWPSTQYRKIKKLTAVAHARIARLCAITWWRPLSNDSPRRNVKTQLILKWACRFFVSPPRPLRHHNYNIGTIPVQDNNLWKRKAMKK